MERSRPQPPLWVQIVFWIAIAALFLPLIVLIISSLLETTEGQTKLTLRWYSDAINDPILLPALGRSLIVAFFSAIIATALGTLGALTLNRWKTPGYQILAAMSALSLALPELVLALSLLSWFALIGMPLSLSAVVIGHITLSLPFASLVIAARMKVLSPRLDDAARDLGASEWQVFSKINLPLLKPALMTSFLLCFLLSFDDFLVAFFTTGAGSDTLPVTLYSLMKSGLTPKLHALASLTLIGSSVLCWLLLRSRLKDEAVAPE
jgi:spermidine/putrescine transport system permease protein